MDKETARLGRCYELALKRLHDPTSKLPSSTVLVHGYPTLTGGPDKGRLYGHAWLEWEDRIPIAGMRGAAIELRMCWDPVAEIVAPAALYYKAGNIDPDLCSRYSRFQSLLEQLEHENYGPWFGVPAEALFAEETGEI